MTLNHPSFVGFDRIFGELERLQNAKQQTFYPPHNIVKYGDDKFIIELAVAGFRPSELDIELNDGVLTVCGEQDGVDNTEYEFIHKGISSKKFKRSFTLSEHVEVEGSDLSDGILSIYLERVIPEEKKPRKIAIGVMPPAKEAELLTE